jgi:hypothetical protein
VSGSPRSRTRSGCRRRPRRTAPGRRRPPRRRRRRPSPAGRRGGAPPPARPRRSSSARARRSSRRTGTGGATRAGGRPDPRPAPPPPERRWRSPEGRPHRRPPSPGTAGPGDGRLPLPHARRTIWPGPDLACSPSDEPLLSGGGRRWGAAVADGSDSRNPVTFNFRFIVLICLESSRQFASFLGYFPPNRRDRPRGDRAGVAGRVRAAWPLAAGCRGGYPRRLSVAGRGRPEPPVRRVHILRRREAR